jgi:hypothetical protein
VGDRSHLRQSQIFLSVAKSAQEPKIVNEIYAFYSGETKDATIDVKALITPMLNSMEKVDPTFAALSMFRVQGILLCLWD